MPKRLPSILKARPSATAPESRAVAGEELWWPPGTGSAGVAVTEETALAFPTLLATANTLATDLACMPIDVFRGEGDEGRVRDRRHPNHELLSRSPAGPDRPETTPIRWRQSWVLHALLWGNGYNEIRRTGRGTPYSLHLLDPETTRPVRLLDGVEVELADPDGVLRYEVQGVRGGTRHLRPENVLHLAGLGLDGIRGLNFVALLRQGLGLGIAMESYAADYFANGADPGGVIETPQKLNPQAIANLRTGWDDLHRGPGKRHRPAVLEQGATWKGTSSNPQQSQLVEGRKFQSLDVARPWRVPPNKYGDLSEAHLANIEASNLDYLNTALTGWLEAIEQEINLKLFTRSEWQGGYFVEHDVDALLRGDLLKRYQSYEIAIRTGMRSINECRRAENLNPVKGGEQHLTQAQNVPIEKAGIAFPGGGPGSPATEPARP
ncbi:phage portal protein [Tautonia plasticadhaerens]|uniref:Phage portal protein n=1 Tax=Tautonia plasticadhaerens TaxID=2527974 RepID=A0A518GZK6_9BACT|nr:phage portal protein [Tautonia plasticadhaerens]QDV34026.1 Phage portal protein [Tautonia plasticadhaerens]